MQEIGYGIEEEKKEEEKEEEKQEEIKHAVEREYDPRKLLIEQQIDEPFQAAQQLQMHQMEGYEVDNDVRVP